MKSEVLKEAERTKVVGRSVPRIDGLEKVTGQAKYADDYQFPGMLYAKVKYAEHPHARILRIDTRKAAALPGVRAVMTAQDIPGSKVFGGIIPDQRFLADDRVRYLGDGVAMVAAESKREAQLAVAAVAVEYELLPAVFDPEEALRPEAPLLHGDTNEVVCHRIRKGDAEGLLARCEVVVEETFRTQLVEHAYLETEAAVAVPQGDGSMWVYGTMQHPFSIRRAVAAALGWPLNRVRIIQTVHGGGFGGKDEASSIVCARAALLAWKTGRPVKLVNTREESLLESYKRHPYRMHYKVGATSEGKIQALWCDILADAGAYASTSPFVAWRSTVQCTGPYEIDNVWADVRAAYTNNTYTGAMRGFGSPQVNFAVESLMDMLAERLGMDPLDLRLKNALRQGSVIASGQVLEGHDVSIADVMQRACEAAGWTEKRKEYRSESYQKQMPPYVRRGIGMAASFRGVSLGAEGVDAAGASISIQEDGSVLVASGIAENGQGAKTVMAQMAAEELGVGLERVRFLATDTDRVPDSGPTVASRGTILGGSAVREAARQLREKLLRRAASHLGVPEDDLELKAGWVCRLSEPQERISFDEVCRLCVQNAETLFAFGWWAAPKTTWDEVTGRGDAYFTYTYNCHVAEVEVDIETGKVRVLRYYAAHDPGRAIHPELCHGQIRGGVAQAIGYGLLEEVELQQGQTRTLNFDEYLVPTAADVGEITPLLVEHPDPCGPFGAKSIAEPATELGAPAIVNAIANATGRRIVELPANLERVLLGQKLIRHGRRGSELRDTT